MRGAIETAFREHYDELGGMLYQLLESKEPQERQIGQLLTGLEYENLVTALNLALEAQVSIIRSLSCSVKLPGYHSGSAVVDWNYGQACFEPAWKRIRLIN